MPLAIQSSIRDLAGKKPWTAFYAGSWASTGVFTTTIYTPAVDQTIEITNAMMYTASGAFTGQLLTTLYDGANYDVLMIAFNAPANYMYPMYGVAWLESPYYIQIKGNVSTAPATAYFSFGGVRYKRGEGVFD